MAVRNIIKIDEDKCNGCGKCVTACAEGAIQLIDGKAKLVSEIYCDGLGACIGECPTRALTIEKRESQAFDEEATKKHLEAKNKSASKIEFSCPGMIAKKLERTSPVNASQSGSVPSQLGQWPVQLHLVPVNAPYFKNANLLLVADCVPFAMGDFHAQFLKDAAVAVGCPKLDDDQAYVDKLAQIIDTNDLNSFTVIHMEVPCCSGLTHIAQKAIEKTDVDMQFDDVTVSLQGEVLSNKRLRL